MQWKEHTGMREYVRDAKRHENKGDINDEIDRYGEKGVDRTNLLSQANNDTTHDHHEAAYPLPHPHFQHQW